MPSQPTVKPVSVEFDKQTSLALRQYSTDVRLSMTEIVERALLCYWVAENTEEATKAVCTASRVEGEPDAAYLVVEDNE